MARAHYHVFFHEGAWNTSAPEQESGPYQTWGEAVAAVIKAGHRSMQDRAGEPEADQWRDEET
jgi:hypothetical protein